MFEEAHVWPPGMFPTNSQKEKKEITLGETSEDGGRSKEAFKDAIDNDVLKEKQINMTYILPCFQCYQ